MSRTSLQSRVPAILKLLASDGRWTLLELLARSDYTVQELVTLVSLPQNLVSYHLQQLRKHGIVTERRSAADHRDIYYHLEMEYFQTTYFAAIEELHPGFRVTDFSDHNALSNLIREKGKHQ